MRIITARELRYVTDVIFWDLEVIQAVNQNFLHVKVYGFGKSEELIGDLKRQTGTSPVIATKFAPLPWRFSADNVVKALKVFAGQGSII